MAPAVQAQARVDVPRLQRPGIERPEHALHGAGHHEGTQAVSTEEQQQRHHVERRRHQQNRSPTEGIGEPAGGQLEEDDGHALHRHHQADLRQRQPP